MKKVLLAAVLFSVTGLGRADKPVDPCELGESFFIQVPPTSDPLTVYTVPPTKRLFIRDIIANSGGAVRVSSSPGLLFTEDSSVPYGFIWYPVTTPLDFEPGESVAVIAEAGASLYGVLVGEQHSALPPKCEGHSGMLMLDVNVGPDLPLRQEEVLIDVPSDKRLFLEELRIDSTRNPHLEIVSASKGRVLELPQVGDVITDWMPLGAPLQFEPGDRLIVRELLGRTYSSVRVRARGTLRPIMK